MERARAKPDSDHLLGLSTKYLSLRNLSKCRHCAIQARESDPVQSSTANKILAIADVLSAAENRFRNRQLDYYSILQVRRSESGNRRVVRAQFVKLAGLLNPNVNKFAFSDEALSLVREAWTVLSDSDKRAQYEAEIDKTAAVAAFWTLCPYCYYMYEYEKVYEDCCLRCQNCRRGFHGVAVNAPRKAEKNGETEYSVCWSYFPLGYEREKEKVGASGSRVNLGGNVGDFVWITEEKKDGKNDGVKGNVGVGRNVKTKAGRKMNVKTVGRKTKKVMGNSIGRNEGMDMNESGDDESVELEFYKGNDVNNSKEHFTEISERTDSVYGDLVHLVDTSAFKN
nr:uncharacterized protein CFP56_17582 [Quercus suber]